MAFSITDPVRYAPVNRRYRQWLAGSVAVAFHVAVIAAITQWDWSPPLPHPEPVSIDVVLTRQPAITSQGAEAIAAADQRASGPQSTGRTVDAAAATAVDTPSQPPAPVSSEVAPASPPEVEAPASVDEPPPALESEPAPESEPPIAEEPKTPPAPTTPAPPDASSEPSAPAETSQSPSGQALLAQASASVRERGFDSSAAGSGGGSESQQAARRAAEARYQESWSRRVETYGNRYYPAPEALDGQLRIRVVIGRDGQLREAEVIQSSGHPELDQAALDTVRGVAPYRPFDSGMGERDSLTITRVWQYGKGNNFGVR